MRVLGLVLAGALALTAPMGVHAGSLGPGSYSMPNGWDGDWRRDDASRQGHRDVPVRARCRRPTPASGSRTALVDALRALAVERGCYGMWVLTDDDNVAATKTYTGAGGARVGESVMFQWGET